MEHRSPHRDSGDPPAGPAIAIIGMSGRFPKANDVGEFWRNIAAGADCYTRFTDEELILGGADPDLIKLPDYVKIRPVLNDIRRADAGLFGIGPQEATLADPQLLVFSEVVWEALDAAGYGAPDHRGTVGLFAGMNISTYLATRPKAIPRDVPASAGEVGNDKDALATNLAYRLDLRGPAVSVQTFCSTSMVAVHLASDSLRRGDCDIAVAGAVTIQVPDRVGYLYREGGLPSRDGHMRPFDAGGTGLVSGDGAAVVALKLLDRALADRDTVLAVIRGSAITNDGSTLKFGFLVPNIDGQRRCVAAAIARAGVDPRDISYVEAFGTATQLGDPIEVAALTSAFGPVGEKQYCLLGSVKSSVGHLDRASGVTGLIKVIQSLRHELIPGTVNFSTPHPEIDFANSPFRVTSEPTPWPRRADRPRIAGVTSLAAGGTNVHAIVTEAPTPAPRPPRRRRWQVVPVSARSQQAAEQACARLAAQLVAEPDLDLGDVAFTMQAGRKTFGHRKVVIADSTAVAAALLSDPAAQLGRTDATVGRRAGFLIAGVGEQYPGMAAALYAGEPGFRADVDGCLAILGLAGPAQLSDIFTTATADHAAAVDLAGMLGRSGPGGGRAGPAAADAHLIQPAVFVAEYALARLLMSWGVQPDIMIGYSLGEYVAACLSGVLSLPDALRLVAHRAKLIASLPAGAMLAVAAGQHLPEVLGAQHRDLDVAIRTGSQLVLAGPCDLVDEAAAALLAAGISCRRLETTHAFHSRMLAPAADELTSWIAANVTLNPPTIPYASNVTGQLVTGELVCDPGYWARHMCGTVQFGDGLARVLAAGDLALAEIGPGFSLGALTRSHPGCPPSRWPLIVTTLPAADGKRDAHAALAEAVGKLWLTGVGVDWQALHAPAASAAPDHAWTPGRIPLPSYPFERQEYWLEAGPSAHGDAAPRFDENDPTSVMTALPRLPDTQWINVPVWLQVTSRRVRADASNWLVFTDHGWADELASALGDRVAAAGGQVVFARPGGGFDSGPDGLVVRPGSTADATAALRELTARGLAPEHVVHLWTVGEPGAGDDWVADCRQRGFDALVAFAQAAGDLGLTPWSLDIVTSGSHQVLLSDPPRAGAALLLGPCRLIPLEYPGVKTRLIDIGTDTASRALLTELCGEPGDQVVALRGGRRWVPGYEVLDAEYLAGQPPAAQIKRGGTYLVTGGLGGIGLAMAERLARDYKARLVLMGRTPAPPREQWATILAAPGTTDEVRRRIDGLHRLASLGASVVTVAGDVSRSADVTRAVNAALEQFGELNGVLHCAGVPAVGMMQFKSPADIDKVLAPKVAGTLALAEVLRNIDIDFLALFSSASSATGGGAGQVDYCAANAFLDAFAASDPLPGRVVVSIGWGKWTWNGWVAGLDSYDEGSRRFFEEHRQTFGITFDEGWQTLQRALASGEPHVIVSTQDFPSIVAMSRRSSIASHQAAVKKARDALGRQPRPDLPTAYSEPQSTAEEAIAEVWAQALGLERVGVNDNFFELGGNSLIGIEIIASAGEALGVSYLPPHLLYQAPTVAALAEAATAEVNLGTGERHQAAQAIDLSRTRTEQRRSTLRGGRTSKRS
jgi:acyl transferase domain-containing protein